MRVLPRKIVRLLATALAVYSRRIVLPHSAQSRHTTAASRVLGAPNGQPHSDPTAKQTAHTVVSSLRAVSLPSHWHSLDGSGAAAHAVVTHESTGGARVRVSA